MKKILSAVLISLSGFWFTSEEAQALSCIQTFPLIGLVESAVEQDDYVQIRLQDYYTFDNALVKDGIYSIDGAVKIAEKYFEQGYELDEKPIIEGRGIPGQENRLSFPLETASYLGIQRGDMILKGGPFHVCDYGMTLVMDSKGNLKTAAINENYNDYFLNGQLLEVAPGKEVFCDKNSRCKGRVNFMRDGEVIEFRGQDEHQFSDVKVKLLDASTGKKQANGEPVFFDWGMSDYVSYVLNFNQAEKPPVVDPVVEEPVVGRPPTAEERGNFEKFLEWVQSLF